MNPNSPKKPPGKIPAGNAGAAPAKTGANVKPPSPPPPKPAPPPPVNPPPLYRLTDWTAFTLTAVLAFLGYLWTIAPDLTLQDCGELSVGSFYAGVPHPPGYPVWTIYTWLFTLLPIGNIAYRVAISSAFAGALSCGLVALMVSRGSSMMIEGIEGLKAIERKWENGICIVAGFVAGLLLGFNGFMWSQAVIVEVYTLSMLSLAAVLVCLFRWIYAPHQRRYLYFAFFWFGICFNNHQSLLVVAMGMEAAAVAVQPRMGRELVFWNVVIYFAGLLGKSAGMIGVLNDNSPLMIVFHGVGIASFAVWVWLANKTKMRWEESVRNGLVVLTVGCLLLLLAAMINYIPLFEYNNWGIALLFLATAGVIAGCVYFIKLTKGWGTEWAAALLCGLGWCLGAAFYFYMPLTSMSNPPLNWGYPRTVTGFFHAFTRGQYEKIHPTFGQLGPIEDSGKFIHQLCMYLNGLFDEFNVVYLLVAVVPFLFWRRLQPREKAWLVGLTATYLCLSLFLLNLLNPAPDRQARDLNKPFFIASHVLVVMLVGYGLTLIFSVLATQYERFRKTALCATASIVGVALFISAIIFQTGEHPFKIDNELFDLVPMFDRVSRLTALFGLGLAAVACLSFVVAKRRAPLICLLLVFSVMPVRTVLSHWSDNEQRGHLFGYWFGHDMFTPPFNGKDGKPIYPEMDRDTVLFGGTDPGRFNPTYMIFCESFIPPSKKPHDPDFDRRDVYLITQNALADGTYLNYIRAHYNRSTQADPPFFSELLRGPRELQRNYETNWIARALMAPIDRFFLDLGDRIEKNRRVSASFFTGSDFIDLASLKTKLRSGQDALSKYVLENLSKETQGLLSGSNDAALRNALAKDLNALLDREIETDPAKRKSLYDPERFKGVTLSTRTQRFIRQFQEIRASPLVYPNQNIHTPVRLARQLLEEAFPKEIAKSLGGVYPDLEIHTPTNEDSQRCFNEYLTEAQRRLQHDHDRPNEPRQLKPGEDVRLQDNKVQVSGQVAVMAINGLLTQIIFNANPDHEFYVEESFPLDWMYPHLTPYGIIMKINRNPLPELTDEMVAKDHEFWSQFSERLIGNWITYDTPVSNICEFAEEVYLRRDYKNFKGDPKFIRDNDGQKAFSKLRSSVAGLYAWRLQYSKTAVEQQRMLKETEFSFKQAYAFCPYSPEAIFRYVQVLSTVGRMDDALLLARTSIKLDPHNPQLNGLVGQLEEIKKQQTALSAGLPPAAPDAGASQRALQAEVARLEAALGPMPTNAQAAYQLAMIYLQSQQPLKAEQLIDRVFAGAGTNIEPVILAAQVYYQLQNFGKAEMALTRYTQLTPDTPEAWFDLAGSQALLKKTNQALDSLRHSLELSDKRFALNSNSPNLKVNAKTDPRFAALRPSPQFQKLFTSAK